MIFNSAATSALTNPLKPRTWTRRSATSRIWAAVSPLSTWAVSLNPSFQDYLFDALPISRQGQQCPRQRQAQGWHSNSFGIESGSPAVPWRPWLTKAYRLLSLPSRDPCETLLCPPCSVVKRSRRRVFNTNTTWTPPHSQYRASNQWWSIRTTSRLAVIEITSVAVVLLSGVGNSHAADEGEGFSSVGEWRAAHEKFWQGDEMRQALGDPTFMVDDNTPVVLERFRVVERLCDPPTEPVPRAGLGDTVRHFEVMRRSDTGRQSTATQQGPGSLGALTCFQLCP